MTIGDRPMLIDGSLVESESGDWIESINPGTEELVGRVPAASRVDVDRAVGAADRAWREWAARPVPDRASHLLQLAELLEGRADEILRLEVDDTGNTVGKMKADVASAVAMLRYYAGLGYELKGESVPATAENLHFSIRQPYGVVARIVPFNHPIQFAASKLAAPLMAGNATIIKPSEQSPMSATILAELCAEVFPPGVVNIVTGLGSIAGDALVRHPRVRRLAFIGSPGTGMAIQRAAAEVAVKHVTLELGGKNPLIVFPDADIARATQAAVSGMNFGHQGQSCGSTSRLFLHDSVHDSVLKDVVDQIEKLQIGDPQDPRTQMGAINSRAQYDKVLHYVQAGIEDGARLVTGGERPAGPQFERGFWLRPTVFADVTPDMRIFREEIFGPVLSVVRWSSTEDMLADVNSTEYGLTASIWTENVKTAFDTARRVEAGFVWINGSSRHFAGTSFGGTKNSGLGTEEGLEELLSYTESKMINVMTE